MENVKLKIGIAVFVFIFIGGLYIFSGNERGVDEIYLLPSGFEGCVVIYYDVEGAEPLKIENDEIVYHVPANGLIYTSSPYDFGWVNDKHSGAFQLKAFYVDDEGDIIEELPPEQIRFGANGSIQRDEREIDYYYQIFGSEETEKKGCPALDI